MLRIICVAALALVALTAGAEGRPRHQQPVAQAVDVHAIGIAVSVAAKSFHITTRRGSSVAAAMDDVGNGPRQAHVIGGRPAGCPRQYCGCGTSIKIFGRIRPELNLAANWVRKFPRTAPAPGMVAARLGHAMVLLEDRGRDRHGRPQWLVYDPNSGKGLTREHVRSLAGFTVVNPHLQLAGL
jgi:hypothetical protein